MINKIVFAISCVFLLCCALITQNVANGAGLATSAVEIDSYVNPCWWDRFNDKELLNYIYKAIEHNQNIKISSYKVLESREQINQYFGKELPQIGMNPTYINSDPFNMGNNGVLKNDRENVFFMPFIASYELDLWQKNRIKTKRQKQLYQIQKQNERSAYITVSTEVASAYFNILRFDKLIELQKHLICLEQQNLDIIKSKYKAGLVPLNEVSSADKDLKEAVAQMAKYSQQQDLFINQLYVLIGETPEQTRNLPRKSIDETHFIKDLPCVVSSDKILGRPDIKVSETNIEISKIDVSLARKNYLPDIKLYGLLSFNSQATQNAFNFADVSKIFIANASEKIFTGGQRRAMLKENKYKYQEYLQDYQKTILVALQEVNDALMLLKKDYQVHNNYLEKLLLENDNLRLININYANGLTSYQSTIMNQINVNKLHQEQVQSKIDCFIDAISLYKALGGSI